MRLRAFLLASSVLLAALALAVSCSEGPDTEQTSFVVSGRDQASDELEVKMRRLEKYVAPPRKMAKRRVRLEATPDMGIGTFATERLRPGDVYVAIPREKCIYRGAIMKSRASSLAKRTEDVFGGDIAILLAVFLMHERLEGSRSPYADYIALLPDRLPTPAFMSATQLELLRGSTMLDAAREDAARLEQRYKRFVDSVLPGLASPRKYTLELFRWAWAMVSSRQINVNGLQYPDSAHLIPFIDMVNCKESSDRSFTSYDSASDAIVLRADNAYNVGEQVFETYDNKSNAEYFQYNGFVMRSNPNDCVVVPLPAVPEQDRERVAAAQELKPRYRPCIGTSNRAVLDAVLRYGAVVVAPPAELRARSYSSDTERRAKAWLREVIVARIAGYPNQPATDAAPPEDESERFALQFVAEELRTLRALKRLLGPGAGAKATRKPEL